MLFDIKNIVFEIWGYPVSYVESIATVFGLISVFYASRANILTWGTGIVNEFFLFLLFFQVQLYSDMFLQVYFFIVTLYGWYKWRSKSIENKVFKSSFQNIIFLFGVIIAGTIVSGIFFSKIHILLPRYFKIQATYPYTDSFVLVASIVASILLSKKKIETWYLWITVDLVCVFLFFKKEMYFLSLEYLVFLVIASYGLLNWRALLKHD